MLFKQTQSSNPKKNWHGKFRDINQFLFRVLLIFTCSYTYGGRLLPWRDEIRAHLRWLRPILKLYFSLHWSFWKDKDVGHVKLCTCVGWDNQHACILCRTNSTCQIAAGLLHLNGWWQQMQKWNIDFLICFCVLQDRVLFLFLFQIFDLLFEKLIYQITQPTGECNLLDEFTL